MAALVGCLPGCLESPMAFSPNGRQLALVVCEPFPGDGFEQAGRHGFRLLVVEGQDVRAIETTTTHMLTGPAYSADGSRLCYLRVPLLTAEQMQQWRQRHSARVESVERIIEQVTTDWGLREAETEPGPEAEPEGEAPPEPEAQPATAPATPPGPKVDLSSTPPLEDAASTVLALMSGPPMEARLIVRRTDGFEVVSDTPVRLPVPVSADKGPSLLATYAQLAPRFDADGQTVLFAAAGLLFAVRPAEGTQRVVAGPAQTVVPRGDGRAAVLLGSEGSLGLADLPGRRTVFLKLDVSWSARPAWLADGTLLAAGTAPDDQRGPLGWLLRIAADGTVTRRVECNAAYAPGGGLDLAASPDGRAAVLAHGKNVYFLDADGKVLRQWTSEEEALHQPVFSPDGSRVAMKLIVPTGAGRAKRTAAVVVFAPDGTELSRQPIAPLPEGTTLPASAPAPE